MHTRHVTDIAMSQRILVVAASSLSNSDRFQFAKIVAKGAATSPVSGSRIVKMLRPSGDVAESATAPHASKTNGSTTLVISRRTVGQMDQGPK